VAYTFYALANTTEILMVGAVFSGLGRCLFSGNNNALLYESLKERGMEKQFHHYHGRAGAMFQLALGMSAVCGGFLAVYGLKFVFLLSIVPQFLMIPISLLFDEPRVHRAVEERGLAHLKTACRHVWRNKRLRLLILAQAIGYGAGESNFRFMGAYVNSLWPVWGVGLYRGLNHACGFTGFWFSGRLVDKIGKPRTLMATNIVPTFLQVTAACINDFVSPIMLGLASLFFGPETVACDQLMQDDFTDAQRATLGSVSSLMGSLSYALFAVCIGAVSDHFGLATGIAFGALGGFMSLPLFMRLFRKHFA
jgi:MFS family permease